MSQELSKAMRAALEAYARLTPAQRSVFRRVTAAGLPAAIPEPRRRILASPTPEDPWVVCSGEPDPR